MNARNQQLQLTVEYRQVKDAILCLFHNSLLHRTVGKSKYSAESSYTLGSIGIEEVDCSNIDLTYVRVNSPELVIDIDDKTRSFVDAIQTIANYKSGSFSGSSSPSSPGRNMRFYGIDQWEPITTAQIKLEFYQKRKRQWPMPEDQVPWEIWELNLEIVRTLRGEDFQRMREFVGEKLADKVLYMCSIINKPQYLPKMPTRTELPYVFEDKFSDCQPYLYRISSDCGQRQSDINSSFMKKFFKDTLSFTA
uniref:Autophagy-related protein 101 n=1 Tax=Acrobeloides nanus TaxID=290746 RepID=A0A914DYM5_9BILA